MLRLEAGKSRLYEKEGQEGWGEGGRIRVARGEVRGRQKLWQLWEWTLCRCHKLKCFQWLRDTPLRSSPGDAFPENPSLNWGSSPGCGPTVDSGWKAASDLRLPVDVLISRQRQLGPEAEPTVASAGIQPLEAYHQGPRKLWAPSRRIFKMLRNSFSPCSCFKVTFQVLGSFFVRNLTF